MKKIPPQKKIRPLGDLEMEIMKILWRRDRATGKEVWEDIRGSRDVALTTVLTVMDRLTSKGLITKTREEGLFVYRPLITAEKFTRETSQKMLKDYMEISNTSLIASFLDTLAAADPAGIERLSRFIEERRKRREDQ